MGNSYSAENDQSNDELMKGIDRLFAHKNNMISDTINTLDISNLEGGCTVCSRNRYEEYEQQLGGMQNKFKQIMKYNSTEVDHEVEKRLQNMHGGGDDVTSELFADEIEGLKHLSTTSNNYMAQNGGRDNIDTNISSSLSGMSKEDFIQGGGMLDSSSYETTGSLGMSNLSNVIYNSNQEINVMPYYSSTSGAEYYNEMQRQHRYT